MASPQGSVLGLILFLIYINDIVNNIKCNTYLFVDDTKIFSGIPDDTYINQLMLDQKSDINTVSKWSDKWHLKLNADKCKIMTVGKGRKAHPSSTHIYKLRLELAVKISTESLKRRILESWLTVTSILKATSCVKSRHATGSQDLSKETLRI